jgi:hypothetical protein
MSLRDHTRTLTDVAALSYGGTTFTGGGEPERVEAARGRTPLSDP